MPSTNLIIKDDDFGRVEAMLRSLAEKTRAKAIFLVDRNGQLIASVGQVDAIDGTALASLTAGSVAATGGLAGLLGQKEFSDIFHEGETENIHIAILDQRIILVTLFDKQAPLGLVRLKVKQEAPDLIRIFDEVSYRPDEDVDSLLEDALFPEIGDEDIDQLFG